MSTLFDNILVVYGPTELEQSRGTKRRGFNRTLYCFSTIRCLMMLIFSTLKTAENIQARDGTQAVSMN